MNDMLIAFMGAAVCVTFVCFGFAIDLFGEWHIAARTVYRLSAAVFGVAVAFLLGFTWYLCILCVGGAVYAYEWISKAKGTTQ